MNTEMIGHAVVRAAIDALQAADERAWFGAFADNVQLFDDNSKINFKKFSLKAIGHERFTSIDKIENDGLTLYGNFQSDHWGEFKTYMRFTVVDGKITKLEIGEVRE
jgi:hypothetical protein